MASDLVRATERAAVISLKSDTALLAIVPKAQIEPTAEAPDWPFIRLDGTQAIPQGRGCTARSEVTFMLHSFAKPRYDADVMVETAHDHAGRIGSAVVEAINNRAFIVDGRRYHFTVRSSRLMRDGADPTAYHSVVSILARAYAG